MEFKKNGVLEYNNQNDINELTYNELTIPYGKQMKLVLSDGTKVDLNAGSHIKYPIRFIEGLNREVFLKGEAYFDVAHKDIDKFIVNVDDLDIEVLGTEFNISHYPEDDNIKTVLVEGSVMIRSNKGKGAKAGGEFILKPGQLASFNKEYKEMAIIETDVKFHTAWRDGEIRFKSASFKNITKVLERRFNKEIENEYKYLDEQIYTASFYNGETFEDILTYFMEDTKFTYTQNENVINITNPL